MLKIKYDEDGTIQVIGVSTAVDGQEIDETTLPDDFMQTFSLGKYKARENEDNTISVVPVPGWIMPEQTIYIMDEIEKMSKKQLLQLQAKLQAVIDNAV